MASIINRSRYVVRVRSRPDLTAEFPYDRTVELEAYVARLRGDGFKPSIDQYEDTILVRISTKGYKVLTATFGSHAAYFSPSWTVVSGDRRQHFRLIVDAVSS